MKNLFLGLLLTVGISGVAFGKKNLNYELLNKNQYTSDKFSIKTKPFDLNIDCTIAIHTVISDKCGNYIGTRKESYQAFGAACSGFEGGISFVVKSESVNTGSCPTLGESLFNWLD